MIMRCQIVTSLLAFPHLLVRLVLVPELAGALQILLYLESVLLLLPKVLQELVLQEPVALLASS